MYILGTLSLKTVKYCKGLEAKEAMRVQLWFLCDLGTCCVWAWDITCPLLTPSMSCLGSSVRGPN